MNKSDKQEFAIIRESRNIRPGCPDIVHYHVEQVFSTKAQAEAAISNSLYSDDYFVVNPNE